MHSHTTNLNENVSNADIKKILALAKKLGAAVKGNAIDFGEGSVVDVTIEDGQIKLDGGKAFGVEYFKSAKDAIDAMGAGMDESVELEEAIKLTNDAHGFMGTSAANGQDYKKNLARVTKIIKSAKLLASDALIVKYLDGTSGRHLADYLSFEPDDAKLKNHLTRDILVFKKQYLGEAIKLTNDVYGFMGTSAANNQDYKKNLARVTKIIKRNKLLASDALIVKYLDSSSGRHLADYFSFEPDDAKLKAHLTRDILVFKKHVLGLSEEFDQGPLTEAKKITASTIAKLFKNTKEWGDDLKNQIRVVKGHLEVVDSFYFSSTDAVKRMISAWTTPNGSYAQYFKSEYGVTFKLVDKFTLISATGRYKKVSDDGIAGIILSVHSDALKESEEREELEEAAAPFKSLEGAWLRTSGDKKKQERLIKKHDLKPIISNVRPGSIKLGVQNKLDAKGKTPHTVAGLDADGELIFVSNNPTKIYYPKTGKSGRPEGAELKESIAAPKIVTVETRRLRRIVELSVNESSVDVIDGFISESSIDLTWTPSTISKAFDKYLEESAVSILETSATVAMVIKALKLKGGKDADALINKMRDLGLESKVSKAHAEAAKKILKGQIAKFVRNESTDLTEAVVNRDIRHALELLKTTPAAVKLRNSIAKKDQEAEISSSDLAKAKEVFAKMSDKDKASVEKKKNDKYFPKFGVKSLTESTINEYRGGFRSNRKGGGQQKVFMIVYNVTFKSGEEPLRLTYSRQAGFDDVKSYVARTMPDAEIKNITVVDKGYSYLDESVDLKEAKAETYDYLVIMKLLKSLRLMPSEQIKILFGLEGKGKKGVYTWDAIEKTLKETGFGKFAAELHGNIKPHMIGGSLGNKAWSVKEETLDEASDDQKKDIADLEKMIKNPDPSKVKEYGGTKYVDMLKKKLSDLK